VKKAYIYLFLAFLLFNFSSVILALKLWQLQAKYEMLHKIKMQQKTEHLAFHKNFFKARLKHGSEFDWDNKRFDVVKAFYDADSVYIEAINDTREKGILHHIGKLMHHQNKQGKNPSKISSLSLLVFQAPLPEIITIGAPTIKIINKQFPYFICIQKVYQTIKTPPPRFCSITGYIL
jgi:hypothetical protein